MTETKSHTDAFNEYYLMGDTRSLTVLAGDRGVSVKTAKKWSKEFAWQARIAQRDIEASRVLLEKADKAVVNTRTSYREDIRKTLQPVKAAINTVIVEDEDGKPAINLKIETAKDFALMVGALNTLAKLDLLMMGEATEKKDINLDVNFDGLSEEEKEILANGVARRRRERSGHAAEAIGDPANGT